MKARRVLHCVLCLSCGGAIAGDSNAPAPLATLVFANEQPFTDQSYFYGTFWPDAQHTSAGCSVAGQGACRIWTCAPDTSSAIGAGTLTLLDDATPTATVSQQDDGTYTVPFPSFAKGDVLGVSATGGQAPGFETESVVAPGLVAFGPPDAVTVLSRTSDATLTWSGGEPDASVFIEVPRSGGPTTTFALCTFDAADGKGVIPEAAIAAVSPAQHGVFIVWQQRGAAFSVGTYALQLIARQVTSLAVDFE